MNKKLSTRIVVGLVLTLVLATPAAGFLSDIAGHWGAVVVTALAARGIINGQADGRFEPDRPLTRAELAKLLVTSLGYGAEADLLNGVDSRFGDISGGHWARGYVEAAAELGLADGYPDGRFLPDGQVTRAEMAAFMVRAAGLTDQARLSRSEVTAYGDDGAIPTWARGSVFVARAEGLMNGLPDGYFYPGRSVTRAEGAAVVYRLLARNGNLFHRAGTLVEFDPARRTGTLRDGMGQEQPFRMLRDAVYTREGAIVASSEIRLLDEVLVVLDDAGRGQMLEARLHDLLADQLQVAGERLQLRLPSGEQRDYAVLPGAVLLVNGHPIPLASLDGAGPAYVALDELTGSVRLVEALKGVQDGIFIGSWGDGSEVQLAVGDDEQRVALAPDLIIFINDQRAGADALLPGDTIRYALDTEGHLSYVEVTR